jgi:hypothetical protein
VIKSVGRQRRGVDPTEVALPAAAVVRCVAVEVFAPKPAARNANVVVFAQHRCEVAHDEHEIIRLEPLAREADDTVVGVIAIDPLEAFRFR